jgi:hypothetical protein
MTTNEPSVAVLAFFAGSHSRSPVLVDAHGYVPSLRKDSSLAPGSRRALEVPITG